MRIKKSNLLLFIFGVLAIVAGYILTVTTHPLIGSAVVGIYLLSSILKLAIEHKEKEDAYLQQEAVSKNVSTINKKVDEILEAEPRFSLLFLLIYPRPLNCPMNNDKGC